MYLTVNSFTILSLSCKLAIIIYATLVSLHSNIFKNEVKLAAFNSICISNCFQNQLLLKKIATSSGENSEN